MISPDINFGHEPKFQRREFRGRESEFKSSDDSKSNSSEEPLVKKHKLVSNLLSPEINETVDSLKFAQKGKSNSCSRGNSKLGRSTKVRVSSSNKNKNPVTSDSLKKVSSKKNSKSTPFESVAINEIKVFMDSLLDELRAARENLIIYMREELLKFMPSTEGKKANQMRNLNNFEFCVETQSDNSDGCLDKSAEGNKKVVSSSSTGNRSEDVQVKKKNRLVLSVKKPNLVANPSDSAASSMYLTLPTVLPEAPLENHGNDNLMLDAGINHRYFSNIHQEEFFQNSTQMGSFHQTSNTHASFSGTQREENVQTSSEVGSIDQSNTNCGNYMGDRKEKKFQTSAEMASSFDQNGTNGLYDLDKLGEEFEDCPHVGSTNIGSLQQNGSDIGCYWKIQRGKFQYHAEMDSFKMSSFNQNRTDVGYSFNIQQDEKVQASAQIGYHKIGSFNPNRTPHLSVGIRPVLCGGFKIQNQVGSESLCQDNNISEITQSRMDGTRRLPGGSNSLSVSNNNIRAHLIHNSDSGLELCTPNFSGLYPN